MGSFLLQYSVAKMVMIRFHQSVVLLMLPAFEALQCILLYMAKGHIIVVSQ